MLTGLARQVAVNVAPVLERMSQGMTEFLTSENRVQKFANSVKTLFSVSRVTFGYLSDVANKVMGSLGSKTNEANRGMGSLLTKLAKVADVFHTLKLGFYGLQVLVTQGLGFLIKKAAEFNNMFVDMVNERFGTSLTKGSSDAVADAILAEAKRLNSRFQKMLAGKTPSERLAASLAAGSRSPEGGLPDLYTKQISRVGELKQAIQQGRNLILEKGSRDTALAARGRDSRNHQKKVAENTKRANLLLSKIADHTKPTRQPEVAGLN